MPEIKKFNDQFEENKGKKESYWVDQFMIGVDNSNSIYNQYSKEIPNLYNRFWNSIIINREIIEPHKQVLIEGNKFYQMLNSFISNEKQPTILLDILLIFITWYIKELNEVKKNKLQEDPGKNNASGDDLLGKPYQEDNDQMAEEPTDSNLKNL